MAIGGIATTYSEMTVGWRAYAHHYYTVLLERTRGKGR